MKLIITLSLQDISLILLFQHSALVSFKAHNSFTELVAELARLFNHKLQSCFWSWLMKSTLKDYNIQ